MEVWELPTSIVVGGIKYDIRTDFRAILDILKTFNDPEFENDEKWIVALTILYIDFDEMPPQDYEEAREKAIEFIDMGIKDDGKKKPHVMDGNMMHKLSSHLLTVYLEKTYELCSIYIGGLF